MNLELPAPPSSYRSPSQRVRISTELWAEKNVYCPACQSALVRTPNNTRVLDFRCKHCSLPFELKSKSGLFGTRIVDGAYSSMMGVVLENKQPNFLLMSYSQAKWVTNLELIPRHFIIPQVIEKRKALSANARRAGWVGCNLRLTGIPIGARIRYIWDGQIARPENVYAQWSKNVFVEKAGLKTRGWLVTTMTLIERLGKSVFELKELYEFVPFLRDTFPGNRNIEAKLRQQLQVLRDQGWLTFLGNGVYSRK
jgi:type II restriction enzyme